MQRNAAVGWISVLAMICLALGLNAGYAADLGGAPSAAEEKAEQSGQRGQAAREHTQPLNNAPVWRDVREGEQNAYQTSQVRGVETTILVQSEGEIWRQLRNGPITVFGGWLLVAVFLAIALFYWWRGRIMLKEPRTGREILRFNSWQRLVHWTTAIAFVLLATSGILMLFGRYAVLPLIGYGAFSAVTIGAKNLHNFAGPLFAVCTVLMVLTFVRGNGFRRHDWTWLRRVGDFLRGRHVSSGRYNAGEKIWFWGGVTLLGIVVSVTGLVLDFPNFGQGRQTMQIANAAHAVAAIGFMAMAIGHIYLGTVGLEGSYHAMRHGSVDETWAKEHHDIWYEQIVDTRSRSLPGPASRADTALTKRLRSTRA
jgi:formate dehydrogenase subunit gamma